jgi:hypothetical protein
VSFLSSFSSCRQRPPARIGFACGNRFGNRATDATPGISDNHPPTRKLDQHVSWALLCGLRGVNLLNPSVIKDDDPISHHQCLVLVVRDE